MKRINLGIAAVFGVTLLSGGAAIADECTQMCRETARDCRSEVRDARRMCAEDGGCDVLRDVYRAICEEEGREAEAPGPKGLSSAGDLGDGAREG